ncbi:hypothetical protein NQZ68_011074 [Dissostichus eleginoides]|nr:hypothetical protein NQZ68_011074 [Dissostichus eleginoides]
MGPTSTANSMLVDGHMDSRLLKQWVNGAAFHTQMLIHQARLEGADGSRAVQAAGVYQRAFISDSSTLASRGQQSPDRKKARHLFTGD